MEGKTRDGERGKIKKQLECGGKQRERGIEQMKKRQKKEAEREKRERQGLGETKQESQASYGFMPVFKSTGFYLRKGPAKAK